METTRVLSENEKRQSAHKLYKRGLLNCHLGLYKKGRDDFSTVIELDAMHAGAFENRSLCHLMLGSHSKSAQDFKRFEEIKKWERCAVILTHMSRSARRFKTPLKRPKQSRKYLTFNDYKNE